MVHPACPLNVECKKTMHIMENNRFKVIIVEDVKLELKGTEEIFRHEIPNAEVIGTAMTENEFWELLKVQLPDMVLLDLGLGGSTTIGVEICSSLRKNYPDMKVLIFTGEVLNEKLWVDALNAGADGIILKTGELLTATDVQAVMDGKKLVFNYPILEKIVAASGMAYGTNYVFSTVRTASDTGRGTGFESTDNSAERKECVSGIRTGKVRLLMRL